MNISASDLTYEHFYIFLCRVIIEHYILGTNNNCYNLNTFKLFGFPICWYLMKVITETYLMKVITETYLMKVITETYLMKVITETYLMKVITETYLMKVITETRCAH